MGERMTERQRHPLWTGLIVRRLRSRQPSLTTPAKFKTSLCTSCVRLSIGATPVSGVLSAGDDSGPLKTKSFSLIATVS